MLGAGMAAALATEGKRGVLRSAIYDNWWNGGNRTTPQRHNMVGVLTEAASVKLASPIFLDKSELRGTARGFPDHRPSINFMKIRYGDMKKQLAEDMVNFTEPLRKKIIEMSANDEYIHKIAKHGAEKAREMGIILRIFFFFFF